jgi:hypothetical protein
MVWQTIAGSGSRSPRSGWPRVCRWAKMCLPLGRRGIVVPYRTLHGFAVAELSFGAARPYGTLA